MRSLTHVCGSPPIPSSLKVVFVQFSPDVPISSHLVQLVPRDVFGEVVQYFHPSGNIAVDPHFELCPYCCLLFSVLAAHVMKNILQVSQSSRDDAVLQVKCRLFDFVAVASVCNFDEEFC